MQHFYIDADGQCYKADKAKSISDMERLNCSEDQLAALPDDGTKVSQFDFEARLRLLSFKDILENQDAEQTEI